MLGKAILPLCSRGGQGRTMCLLFALEGTLVKNLFFGSRGGLVKQFFAVEEALVETRFFLSYKEGLVKHSSMLGKSTVEKYSLL